MVTCVGSGGAAVKIVTNQFTLHGSITMDGTVGYASTRDSGGGSGGSIWIDCDTMSGLPHYTTYTTYVAMLTTTYKHDNI